MNLHRYLFQSRTAASGAVPIFYIFQLYAYALHLRTSIYQQRTSPFVGPVEMSNVEMLAAISETGHAPRSFSLLPDKLGNKRNAGLAVKAIREMIMFSGLRLMPDFAYCRQQRHGSHLTDQRPTGPLVPMWKAHVYTNS